MVNVTRITKCFYRPGQPSITDAAVQTPAGEWIGRYGGQTLSQLRDEHPDIELRDLDEVVLEIETSLITAPQEITEEQWSDALECLPPEDWRNGEGGESFKMMEYYSGNITTIYVRLGQRYFSFYDRGTLPHADCVAKAMRALNPTP